MNAHLLTHWWSLPQLVVDLVLLSLIVMVPLRRDYGDDQGDGKALVLLPEPHKTSSWRALAFLGVFIVLDVIHEGLRAGNTIDGYYSGAVRAVASTAVDAPAQLNAELAGFTMATRFLVVGTILALAATSVGSFASRVRLVYQAVIYLAVMVLIDAILTVLGAIDPIFGSPRTIIGQLLALFVGALVLLRAIFACYALPKPTAHPLPAEFAPRRRRNALKFAAVTLVSMALILPPAVFLLLHAGSGLRPIFLAFLPLPVAGVVTLVRALLLNLLRCTRPPDPEPGSHTPWVEVVVPAFNEEACIVGTLQAIDVAAGHYPGLVRIVLANDGSTDRTKELAEQAGRAMQHAKLDILDVRHGGKSATLNTGLAACRGEVVVRIDADTIIGEESLLYATRWFADPGIGLVESLPFSVPSRSIFPRLRLFETLRIFGFMHRGLQMVDGVNVIPGMFTAFRREAVVAVGGFTVGMNGEDADITLTLGRLGWRTWLDPKVIIYEDVPPSYWEFRQQRIRWSRAGIHAFARHSPFRSGAADPRVWYTHVNQTLWKVAKPYHLTGFFYVLLVGVFRGWNQPIVEAAITGIVVFMTSSTIVEFITSARYRVLHRFGWFVFWFPFTVLKSFFVVESLLSLPARPALAFAWTGQRSVQAVTAPVLH